MDRRATHPYIPNGNPHTTSKMLRALGITSPSELHSVVPPSLRFAGQMDLPPALVESDLRRKIEGMLSRNRSTQDHLSFLGGGCWSHYVPAVCDEFATRSEFVTAYHDGPRGMLGSYQAQFEFQSMLGELIGLDAVGTTLYDWGAAASSGLLMACRITGRPHALVYGAISPDRLRQIRTMTRGQIDLDLVSCDPVTGEIELSSLEAAIAEGVGAVYFEVPGFLGTLDPGIVRAVELSHASGVLVVIGVDPSCLGVIEGPGGLGADIAVGDLQPLGMHMAAGGGCAGFIATRHEEEFIGQLPMLLLGLHETDGPDEYLFEWTNFEETSYGLRDTSPDFTGTTQTIWAIVAAVYLSLMGPEGMRELGEKIRARSCYAMNRLSEVPGVTIPALDRPHFKEFVVRYDVGRSVTEIHQELLRDRIFGGLDLSSDFDALHNCALFSVTENHTEGDIDQLVDALERILR